MYLHICMACQKHNHNTYVKEDFGKDLPWNISQENCETAIDMK